MPSPADILLKVPIVLIPAALVCLVASFFFFDRLLRFWYVSHPEYWRRQGSPIGFFWVPRGVPAWGGSLARNDLSLRLFFSGLGDWPAFSEPLCAGCGSVSWLLSP